MLSEAVLQYLDSEGYTIIDRDVVWHFHHSFNSWLNHDDDEHRLSNLYPVW